MIQSIQRAMAVLEAVSEDPERPTSLSEVAGRLGLKLSTCANILQTLLELGYLDQADYKGGYTLGPMAYHLTRKGPYRRGLVEAAMRPMAELAGRVRESVLLAAMGGGRRTTLCQVDGNESFRIREGFLAQQDVYRTATGRLLLAHLPEAELRAFLAVNGLPGARHWPEAGTEAHLLSRLAALRRAGRAITEGDPAGIACPVRDGREVVAALGLFLPRARFQGEHRTRVLAGVAEAAAAISRQLEEQRRDADRTHR
ncbi:MAG: helix-turn-helix domain-containing protein [Candidatus Brocadiaceae bacterium]|nr:helix-turn-helix domain-containing protein [Candidatus Brocadiaceae bacterium]